LKDKGYTADVADAIRRVAADRPNVRFVFLAWGANANQMQERTAEAGLNGAVIYLPAAGKKRLLDYYRSCDIVLDQLVFGYLGATALEAASVGKPVIMKLRAEHYSALYDNDVAPVRNVESAEQLYTSLLDYVDHPALRARDGGANRAWLVRTHGSERTMPLLLALLRFTADGVPLPSDVVSPLSAPLTDDEIAYHVSCLKESQPSTALP
jgi:glycosyltransferase involved in cell wall biosynthesis